MSSRPGVLSPRRFLALCLIFTGLACSPLVLSYAYLDRHGETLSPAEIVDRLEANPAAYYRSIMHDNLRETALEIVRRRQPEVVALGSSLTFDMREEYFTSSFACAGGVMDTLADGDQFVREMLKLARPNVVLFILNYWWFTDDNVPRRGPILPRDESPRFSFSQLRMPFKQIKAHELSVRQFLGLEPLPMSDVILNSPLGLMAVADQVGRRADGSQLNGLVFSPRAWEFYAPVRDRFARIDSYILQPGRFGPDMHLHADRLDLLEDMIRRMTEAGCHVVLVNPPLAPPLVAAMARSGRHGYYFDFGPAVAKLGAESYDFHDPLPLGIPPSEFADTHHAGNTAYMRLLLEIARRNPASPLSLRLNREGMQAWVAAYAGATVAVLDKDHIRGRETDFLGLGVQKPAPRTAP